MTTAADFVRAVRGERVDRKLITATLVGLVAGIYEDGALDRLPILADALEEAGVTDAGLLEKLRNAELSERDKEIQLARVLTEDEAELMKLAPRGSTVYSVLRHVSSSGMLRRIDFYAIRGDEPRFLSGRIANLLDLKRDRRKDGLRVHGTGQDMGFHVVYELAYKLYGDGYALNQRWI